MLNVRFVSIVLIFAMLMWVPLPAIAADAAARTSATPQVSTSAAPLSPAEMARYGQLQSQAREDGTLAQRGGADETTWLVIGTIAIVAIVTGLLVAVKQ
jgi:hypothetical protein